MSFWNKLGKIALTAAPYVAAPFTGGASLMATGLANKAVQKWSESDAKKAVAKGLAPSKFDANLGKIGGLASMASMFIPGGQLGMLGKAGDAASKAGTVATKTGGLSNFLQGLAGGGSGLLGAAGNSAGQFGMSQLDRIGQPSAETVSGQPTGQPANPNVMTMNPQYTDVMAPFQSGLSDSIFAGRQNARKRSVFA